MFIITTAIKYNLVFGLIGFDCGQKFTNFTTFSLVNVGECDISEPIINATKTEISLLQLNEYADTLVRYCKIEIDHRSLRNVVTRINREKR